MSLRERLVELIAKNGSMAVSTFMDLCLHDPVDGYYATQPGLGGDGDFITAPHVSQMFGEILGLWAAEVWSLLGRPARVLLVELGPGDGAMMADMLRAARTVTGFLAACEIWLVDSSPPLRAIQAARLADIGVALKWAAHCDDLPADAPLILIANEFLDCLPIRQYVRTTSGWSERRVALNEDGDLSFHTYPTASDLCARTENAWAPVGAIVEVSSALTDFARVIGARLSRVPGAALFIDYGREARDFGDTLQALAGHAKEGPLANPGQADLTAHVDFPAFARAARNAGALASRVRTQGAFLRELGIESRADVLARAHPDGAAVIGRQLDRLIGASQMGDLFKVLCVHSAGISPPALEETGG